ncbi:MAG TPA: hypothetical protein VFS43_04570 [Polyangiaceae bacterium]|nr:hypothetical protein [Polyangiaceae bacterium]
MVELFFGCPPPHEPSLTLPRPRQAGPLARLASLAALALGAAACGPPPPSLDLTPRVTASPGPSDTPLVVTAPSPGFTQIASASPSPSAAPPASASPSPSVAPPVRGAARGASPGPGAAPATIEARGGQPPSIDERNPEPFAATKAQWVDFLTRAGAQGGKAPSAEAIERAFRPPAPGASPADPTPWDVFCARLGLAPDDPLDALCWHGSTQYLSLFVADVDNDGRDDFLLTAINPVGAHDEWPVGLWTPKGPGLERRAFEALEAFQPPGIVHFAKPFLRRDPEGLTFTLWGVELFDRAGRPLGYDPRSVEQAVRRRDTFERWIVESGHARRLDARIEDENYATGRKQRRLVPGGR